MGTAGSNVRERAWRAYVDGAWSDATDLFLLADSAAPLAAGDIEALGWAAAISGRDQDMLGAFERLHAHCAALDDDVGAARAAFWTGLRLMMMGEVSRGAGWLQRAGGHAERTPPDCAQRGYLLLPQIQMHRSKGAFDAALDAAGRAIAMGQRVGDPDLVALAGCLKGGILFALGRIADGFVPIDETMLLATDGRLSPLVCAVVYCDVISACCRVQEMVRAREWTAELTAWCARNPQARAFNGQCLVHRAEIMQLEGDWAAALEEARKASEQLQGTNERTAMASAAYRRGEICRLQGRFADAEAHYLEASDLGRDPQPGLALLRRAQGRTEDAGTIILRAVETAAEDLLGQAALLPACVEILLAAGALDQAADAATRLRHIAERFDTEMLAMLSDQAWGALDFANGNVAGAIALLAKVRNFWAELGAPYLAARLRVEIARGYASLGDAESADLELTAAEKVFRDLGAEPDLAAARALRSSGGRRNPLTPREREVLARLAEGLTNRETADALGLSAKTVNRHVENIFNKIGVSTRAAAVAKAMKADLL